MLELVVFFSGAVIMALELTGSRVLSPYLGSSVYVWTSLIGVILASMSAGYWWGGRIADRGHGQKGLGFILLGSAVLTGIIAIVNALVLDYLAPKIPDVRIAAVIVTVILFAPAALLLGMVSPYAIRLKIESVVSSGSTIGRMYAISTAGSIVGTFAAGFVLMAKLGTGQTIVLLAAILLVLSVILLVSTPKSRGAQALAALFIGFAGVANAASQPGFLDLDTNYARVWVVDVKKKDTGRPLRGLVTDPFGMQSWIFPDNPDETDYLVALYYRMADAFAPAPKRALLIGGAAYVHPRDFLARHPGASMDVVEIDPGLTEIARRYFALKDDPRMHIFHEDGRNFLNRAPSNTYDVVFIDAYGSNFAPPPHLTTVEMAKLAHASLTPRGIVMMNVISAVEGDAGRLLRGIYATYRAVFPKVRVYTMREPGAGSKAQNLLVVAQKSEDLVPGSDTDLQVKQYLEREWQRDIPSDVPVLTDDFAPVEHYVVPIISQMWEQKHKAARRS